MPRRDSGSRLSSCRCVRVRVRFGLGFGLGLAYLEVGDAQLQLDGALVERERQDGALHRRVEQLLGPRRAAHALVEQGDAQPSQARVHLQVRGLGVWVGVRVRARGSSSGSGPGERVHLHAALPVDARGSAARRDWLGGEDEHAARAALLHLGLGLGLGLG